MPESDASLDSLKTAVELHRSALKIARKLQSHRSAAVLSLSKLTILGELHREGVCTAAAMASALRLQPQSLTRVLAALERQSLIARRPNSSDRRESLIQITAEGEALLAADVLARRVRLAEAISATLTPTEQQFLRIAAGLMDRLASSLEDSPELAELSEGQADETDA
jgi:DNA-binding MarR family transcriptional regulator